MGNICLGGGAVEQHDSLNKTRRRCRSKCSFMNIYSTLQCKLLTIAKAIFDNPTWKVNVVQIPKFNLLIYSLLIRPQKNEETNECFLTDTKSRLWGPVTGHFCSNFIKSKNPTGGLFLAPAESCSLQLHTVGPFGPTFYLRFGEI